MSQGLEPSTGDTLQAFTGGDLAAAALLRDSLTRLHDQLGDQRGDRMGPHGDRAGSDGLRRGIAEVLAGRMAMSDLADDPELRALADEGMRDFQAAWEKLSPAEREAQLTASAAPVTRRT